MCHNSINFTKIWAYCVPSRSDFLTYFDEISIECLRNTATDHRVNEHNFYFKKSSLTRLTN